MQMNPTKSSNSGEVPIHNLFGLVERYLDLDQTDGPHRYYGWDDLAETIPRTVFNKVKIGSYNKNPKLIVLTVEFLIWCCSKYPFSGLDKYEHPDPQWQQFWIETFPKIRDDFIRNVTIHFGQESLDFPGN